MANISSRISFGRMDIILTTIRLDHDEVERQKAELIFLQVKGCRGMRETMGVLRNLAHI